MHYWLTLLTLLFSSRVLGQLVQWIYPTDYLPEFSAFQGSSLSYPLLLSSQVLIIATMVWTILRVRKGWRPSLRASVSLRLFGIIYFAAMFLRLLVGSFELLDYPWFQKSIPAFFHLVLACFVLSLAQFGLAAQKEKS